MITNVIIFFIILLLILQMNKKNHIYILITIWILLCFVNNREGFSNQNDYCIVIPSYPPHFKYVNKLLDSIEKYNTDKEPVTIYLTMNREDNQHYEMLNFKKINLIVLYFEDLVKEQLNITMEPNEFLKSVEKYTFQSMKKLMSIQHGFKTFNYVYVLDSESMFFRTFSMSNHVNNYLQKKQVFYNSRQRKYGYPSTETSKSILNVKEYPGWLLENYLWIYEKDIFQNVYNIITKKIETKDNLYKMKKDIFIEVVYYHYIYLNNTNYTFIDTYEKIKPDMNENELNDIISKPYTLLEDTRWNLNENTYNAYLNFFKRYRIVNYKIQVNDINLKFIKDNTQIILINSGDFPLEFEIK